MSTTNTIMPSLTADEIANLSNYIFTLNIDTLLDNSTTTRQARNRVNSRPPRPPNAFIMYRRDMVARNITQFTNLRSAEVSRIIGNMWNAEPTQVREVFQSLARLSERRHSEMYRDYRL